jgi:cytochrome c-type biogenesis protein
VVGDLVRTGLSAWWAPALAFAAGVVSFASPCVLPLVPAYLSFVSGSGTASSGGTGMVAVSRARAVAPMLLFAAGFATVFTLLGAFATTFVPVIKSTLGQRIAGLVIAAFGVFMLLYAFRIGWGGLYAERRPLLSRVKPGPSSAFPLGMAFAAGWTPCIGPVLGGILAIASIQGDAARGALLLFTYSLGLGVPFLLIGLGVTRVMRSLQFVKRNYHWVAGVSGAVMIGIGVLLVTGLWLRLLSPFLRLGNRIDLPI